MATWRFDVIKKIVSYLSVNTFELQQMLNMSCTSFRVLSRPLSGQLSFAAKFPIAYPVRT